MSDKNASTGASLPVASLERIDRVCLEFEAIWKEGVRPRIEEHLAGAHGPERAQLLRELLLLDLDYRGRSHEQPSEDEYRTRFPQDSQLVSEAFEKLSTGAAVPETDPSQSAPNTVRNSPYK